MRASAASESEPGTLRRTNGTKTFAAAAMTAVATLWMGQALSAKAAPASPAVERILQSFGGANGAGPLSGVMVGPGGLLYGTTVFGGEFGGGCVFALIPDGSGYAEQILYSFRGSDGAKPAGNVVADDLGNLFGATILGGTYNQG